jgi:hypothetical protein
MPPAQFHDDSIVVSRRIRRLAVAATGECGRASSADPAGFIRAEEEEEEEEEEVVYGSQNAQLPVLEG